MACILFSYTWLKCTDSCNLLGEGIKGNSINYFPNCRVASHAILQFKTAEIYFTTQKVITKETRRGGVALLVTNLPHAPSNTKQNSSICNPPLHIAVTFKPNTNFLILLNLGCPKNGQIHITSWFFKPQGLAS